MKAGKNTVTGASTSPTAATGPAPASAAGFGPVSPIGPGPATSPNGALTNRTGSVTPAKRSLPDSPLRENEMFCEKCKQVRLKSDFLRNTTMGRPEYFKQCEPCRDKKRKSSAALKARRQKEEQEKNENETKKRQTPKNDGGKSRQKVKAENDDVQSRQQERNQGGKTYQREQTQAQEQQEHQGQQNHGYQQPEHQYYGQYSSGEQHLGQQHLGQQNHEQQNSELQQHEPQPLEPYAQAAQRPLQQQESEECLQAQQQDFRTLQQGSPMPDVDMNEELGTAYSTSRLMPQAESYSSPGTDVSEEMPGHQSHALSTPVADPTAQTQHPMNLDYMQLEEDMAYYNDQPAGSVSPSAFLTTDLEVPDGITACDSNPASMDGSRPGRAGNLVVSDTGSPGFVVPHAGPSKADPYPSASPLGDLSVSLMPYSTAGQIPGGVKLTSEHFELTHTVVLKTAFPDDVIKTRIDFERRKFRDAMRTCHFLRCQSDESLRRIWRKREAAIVLDLIVVPLPEPQPVFGSSYGDGSHRNIRGAYSQADPTPKPWA
ncbi:hypothetical protein CkaCkLH20_11298 [Colletotrichum karsti]|uniref:Uncharacterized protein n=1 Tax=Colletotrichum karsti TaxID=1095194 RepID=A0A9P6HVC8_9PEZI|nr:uncharacterized protein CkaCkLH20_11298 [Colletotrichum karsti]KAF9871129.1 hypothetical protein CkaCkLH20_11298 [Colletotrichum karsti]